MRNDLSVQIRCKNKHKRTLLVVSNLETSEIVFEIWDLIDAKIYETKTKNK